MRNVLPVNGVHFDTNVNKTTEISESELGIVYVIVVVDNNVAGVHNETINCL